MTHTITTAKGTFTGTIRAICEWQASMQGALADVDGVTVADVDFDSEDIDAAIAEVSARLAGDVMDAVADALDRLDLPEGIRASAHEVTGENDDGDEALVGVVVHLHGLPGVTWGDEVEDAIDLTRAGLAFSGDSGGLGGPCVIDGTTYDGGTYQRWEVSA